MYFICILEAENPRISLPLNSYVVFSVYQCERGTMPTNGLWGKIRFKNYVKNNVYIPY